MSKGDLHETANNVNDLATICRMLTTEELEFLAARLQTDTDRAAAEMVNRSPSTVSRYPHKNLIDEALRLVMLDGVTVAAEIIRRAATRAAEVKIDGLKVRDMRLRQAVASEILDRVGLIVEQRVDVTSKGEKIGGADGIPDENRMAAAMAVYERIRARLSDGAVDGESAVGTDKPATT